MPVTRERGRAWAGRSYAHLVLPYAYLDDERCASMDRAVIDAGTDPGADVGTPGEWQVVEDGAPEPRLVRSWRHRSGTSMTLLVLGWYPLLVTVGPGSGRRGVSPARKAERRLVEAAVRDGGRAVPDRDLDRLVTAAASRWDRVLQARQQVEQQRIRVESRRCASCGSASDFGAVHCRACGRRFGADEDAERDEGAREAGAVIKRAQQELASLGRGEGLFRDWPGAREAS